MSDLIRPGLQIDPRCIKCGTSPTIQVRLLEMQNHLYICDACRHEEEQKGKRIAWASSIQTQPDELAPPQIQAEAHKFSGTTLFNTLEVATDASLSEIKDALEEKMRFWMYQPDSDEKAEAIERLRRWQEDMISDPHWLDAQRSTLPPQKAEMPTGSALVVNERQVYTAQEFVDACEASKQGWYDGEQLLRQGELQHWILFQLENRTLASEVGRLAQADIPDFRVLNSILYRLVPERPFRMYAQEIWEPISQVPHATTPLELAQLCDTYWERGEHHLYKGSLLYWLEYTQHCQGLSQYYSSTIRNYEHDRFNRGAGLELLLERAIPQLQHPQLRVTFDGIENQYTMPMWDREIPHKPLLMHVENLTRGYTYVTLEVIKSNPKDPEWVSLEHIHTFPSPSSQKTTTLRVPGSSTVPASMPLIIKGRPGMGMPAQKIVRFSNIATLKPGKLYSQLIRMTVKGDFRVAPVVHEYPITLPIMTTMQGFRGELWRKGLRGGLPGLAWNFAAGAFLASCALLLVPLLLAPTYANWQELLRFPFTFGTVFAVSASGSVDLLYTLNFLFIVAIASITGVTGLLAGNGKGHTNYTAKNSLKTFSRTALWSAITGFFILLAWFHSSSTVSISSPIYALWHSGGSLFIGLLIFILVFLVAMIRSQLEKSLRIRHTDLLNPPGKE